MLSPPRVREAFQERFGRPCTVVARAPGRVNLIGEHVDYNDGLVLPIALPQCTWAAAAPREDDAVCVRAAALRDERTWPAGERPRSSDAAPRSGRDWAAYVAGVESLLRARGARLGGFDLLIDSDVPIGSGLASSAALEVSAALALAHLAGEPLTTTELAALCRAAEHEFAGVPCGIMDQCASLMCEAGQALLLDCRTQRTQQVPCSLGDHHFSVVDSGVTHSLADGQYAQRVESCTVALRHFQALSPQIRSLRDVAPATARAQLQQIAPPAGIRALHVTSEIARTEQAAAALRAADAGGLGRLLDESHRSLSDLYEVSCPEIEDLIARVRGLPGVLGARLTGAGFGGCIVVLARDAATERIDAVVRGDYARAHAGRLTRTPHVIDARPSRGASLDYVA